MHSLTEDPLFHEILRARQRVYAMAQPTPLQRMKIEGIGEIWIKREDVSPIHAYKWRGAYNKMAALDKADRSLGVITASAGNHAQGVALSAKMLGAQATIYMPRSTLQMKQIAVQKHGGDAVDIRLEGDTFSESLAFAIEGGERTGKTFVHAYDDLTVMAGQGTLADEVVMSGQGPFDRAYIQVGGGGLAAGVACWLKVYYPGIEIIGVEGEDQASMQAAVQAGEPVTLDYVDVFCDGTAVRRAGDQTFGYCQKLIDRFVTVSNAEVSAAIKRYWETMRVIPEPSGALGLAGALRDGAAEKPGKTLCILCGANMDLSMLTRIAATADVGSHAQRYFRFHIDDHPGTLLSVLHTIPASLNVVDFRYGRTPREAAPIVGLKGPSAGFEQFAEEIQCRENAIEEIEYGPDIEFGIIPFKPDPSKVMRFFKLEFHERPGALSDFLSTHQGEANICFFKYAYSGETVGRALVGFEFLDETTASVFSQNVPRQAAGYRAIEDLGPDFVRQISEK
ncbi:MAG: pyridoxal-phosphate dependent enzyme [Opitutales bacterium]|nr:pyridoxal-phosphate dependent enzyme [Opitutales bacterium]